MGYYINPPDRSKEDFLGQYGTGISSKDAREFDFQSNALPVCLVNNGAFTAAGIGYSPQEVFEFDRSDGRLKTWFSVPKKDLEPYYKE